MDWNSVPAMASTQKMNAEVAQAHRVVVKIGSSSLTTLDGGLDLDRVGELVEAIAAAHDDGRQIVLVSSGAIAAGLAPLGFRRRPKDLASQQAAASIGQGLLIAHYARLFAAHQIKVGQVLLTVGDVTHRATYKNVLSTMSRLLRLGTVPVVNENDTVATHEIRFGDNDRLAALVAHLVRAEALILLSDVDGLYTGAPDLAGSRFIAEVADLSNLVVDTSKPGRAGLGTGGMTTKLQAAEIATSAGIPVVLTRPHHLGEALSGQQVGTFFHPAGRRRSRRLLWLAHGADSRGELVLDAGAVGAISRHHASLLAAGITGVRGGFVPGDPIDLVNPDGRIFARGVVNYTDQELATMIGRRSSELGAELGHDYERAVVHRDWLIVLSRYQQQARGAFDDPSRGGR